MKKIVFKKYKKKNKINYITMSLVICILFMSIGYSVFNSNLMVDNITAVVRPTKDIRVTGANASNLSNQAMIDWVDYNVKSISLSVVLPQQDSTVTFKVQITNIGSTEMGIFNITGLPNNLEYTLSDYQMKDKLCNENICSLGMQKYITITIKYKDGSPIINSSQTIKLDFDFRPFHKIIYTNFDEGYTSSYPQDIIDGDTFKMTLKQPYPVGAKPFIRGVGITYHYDGDTLIVENITEDLEIRSNYIQYVEDIVSLSNKVASKNTYSGKTIYMENNIDFQDVKTYRNSGRTDFGDLNGINGSESLLVEMTTGSGFEPIGNYDGTRSFKGTFKGNNKTISNLYIEFNKSVFGYAGLFGRTENLTLSDLTVEGNIHTISEISGAGIVGTTYGTATIDNCINKVNVTSTTSTGNHSVGGIVGPNHGNLKITNSKNYGNISVPVSSLSGILGDNVGSKLEMNNCINYGDVTGSGSNVGGLVAFMSVYANINNSTNYGKITDNSGSNLGGIVGCSSSNNLNISNCKNYGEILFNNKPGIETHVGGIAGYLINSITKIEYSINDGKLSDNEENTRGTHNSYLGGICGYTRNSTLSIENSNNTADIIGGTKKAGIIGYLVSDHNSTTLINKCYSIATISTDLVSTTSRTNSSGFVGYSWGNGTLYILNSYNKSNLISPAYADGVHFMDNTDTINISGVPTTYLINSYNTGSIKGNYFSGGLATIEGGNGVLVVNNYYNHVQQEGNKKYAIGFMGSNAKVKLTNTYYNSTEDASNLSLDAIYKNDYELKSQTFVDLLNNNIKSIKLSEIDPYLSDFTLSRWKLGEDGYPTLDIG